MNVLLLYFDYNNFLVNKIKMFFFLTFNNVTLTMASEYQPPNWYARWYGTSVVVYYVSTDSLNRAGNPKPGLHLDVVKGESVLQVRSVTVHRYHDQ